MLKVSSASKAQAAIVENTINRLNLPSNPGYAATTIQLGGSKTNAATITIERVTLLRWPRSMARRRRKITKQTPDAQVIRPAISDSGIVRQNRLTTAAHI